MAIIDIGSPAINRGASLPLTGYTFININNPANATGRITSIEIWANTNLTGCEVAIFYNVSGNIYSTRDTHYIGNVAAGAKRTFSVNLNVEAGDYIGIYYAEGKLESDNTGGSGWFADPGDQIPCTNHSFGTYSDTAIISLCGTGTTSDIDIGVPALDYTSGWCHGTIINKSNPANASGNITKVAIYSKVNMINVTVALFYCPDPDGFPNNLTTRDGGNQYISDLIAPGYHEFEVNLNVIAGDYIGVQYTNGDIEKKIGEEQGVWYINYGDWVPCTNKTFSFQANNGLALYGEGNVPVIGIKWNGVTISKWNGKVITKLN